MKQNPEGAFLALPLARISISLGLALVGAACVATAPAVYAQQAVSDQALAANVVKTIGTYPDLAGEQITATSQDGVVTLGGTATSETTKDQAQVVAATVEGVRSVVNNVTVASGSLPASSQGSPEPSGGEPQQATSGSSQAPYTPQQQPDPGAQGNWGQAGPPPDVVNGRIPPPSPDNQTAGGQQGESQPPEQGQSPPLASGEAYPGNRPAYVSRYQNAYAQPRLATTPVTIEPGTLISVRTSEPLDSKRLQGGEIFQAVLAQDQFSGPYLAIPRGAVLQLQVVGVKKPGAFRGEGGFALKVVSLNLGGQTYPLTTDTFATDIYGKGGYTTTNTVGGAALGALIGALAGGGPGAAIGAVAGGGVGLGASAASEGPRSVMPPETLLTFHLQAPLTLNPISMAEVQQLHASAPVPQAQYARPRRVYAPYRYGYYPPPPPPPPYYPYWR